MMQFIIEETRRKIIPLIGAGSIGAAEKFSTSVSQSMPPAYDAYSRLVRKIPPKNYSELPKLIPISWL